MATTWVTAAGAQYADPRASRDEAVRSASFGAAMLMQAARAMGLASGPIGGFDAAGVAAAAAQPRPNKFLSLAALVVGVFAAVLQKLLNEAINIKSENDLTV